MCKTCSVKYPNCLECSESVCTKCHQDTTLKEGTCVTPAIKEQNCPTGYYKDIETQSC